MPSQPAATSVGSNAKVARLFMSEAAIEPDSQPFILVKSADLR